MQIIMIKLQTIAIFCIKTVHFNPKVCTITKKFANITFFSVSNLFPQKKFQKILKNMWKFLISKEKNRLRKVKK